jgi:thiamine transport system substrate-binding protein
MRRFTLFLITLVLLVGTLPISAQDDTLTLVTHDSFNVSSELLDAFTAETGITVEIVRVGDAGALVNQSILSAGNPLGDVLFGVDNTFLGRSLEADLFVPYESPALETVPDEFETDPEFRVTPIDYGDVCLNYDAAYFAENDLPLPESLRDLADPMYKGMLTVQNPATSSPGLAFLLATVAVFGEEGDYTYLDYWRDLVENEVYVSPDWTDAYYGQFSGSAGSEGSYPMVVSYASSPPVEVYFMETPPETAPTGAIVADDTCFRQIEYAGILRGTANEAAAQTFIDFMLSERFQTDMPLQMFVYPIVEDIELPEVFTAYSEGPENPVVMEPATIDEGRDRWIQAWTETVLR